jgi:hypothetical protein
MSDEHPKLSEQMKISSYVIRCYSFDLDLFHHLGAFKGLEQISNVDALRLCLEVFIVLDPPMSDVTETYEGKMFETRDGGQFVQVRARSRCSRKDMRSIYESYGGLLPLVCDANSPASRQNLVTSPHFCSRMFSVSAQCLPCPGNVLVLSPVFHLDHPISLIPRR